MKLKRYISVFVLSAVLTGSAFAGAILNKTIQANFIEGAKSDLESTNTACGSSIKIEIPMDKYDQKLWGQDDNGGGGYGPPCGIIMEGIRSVCSKSDDFKKEVASKLKTLVCQPTSAKTFSVKMSGSKLTFLAADPNVGSNPNSDAAAKVITNEIDK